MKHIFFKTIVCGLAAVALTSCGEPDDVITDINFGRNFAPTSFEAKVRNRTNVELSWNLGEGVTKYNVEVYANDSLTFSGSPVMTFSVSPDQVPYTVMYLEGETDYSFRVQAADDNASRDSKWSGAYAKTDAEQLFKNVGEADIKATEVTLRWAAGQEAATIKLMPGNITYQVTAADVAAGAATVTGLTPETDYTATLLRSNGKTRGTVKFTTSLVLEDGDVLVKAGNSLVDAINAAADGARLILEPGEYGIPTADAAFGGSIAIKKALKIKGLKINDHPVIKGRFQVEADFDVNQVTLDGKGTDGGQAFDFTADGSYDHFTLTNSEVKNYTKGLYYMNKATLVNTISIEGCVISNIECSGGDFMDARKGGFNTLSFKNNTVVNSAQSRDFIRMDNNSSNVTAAAKIVVDHNTLYNVGSGNGNYRVFYVRWASGNTITFTNNLVVGTNYKRGFANQASTDKNPTLSNNVYFNTVNLISAGATADATITWFDAEGKELDPQFKDAANGDFTVQNDNVKDTKAGDPRWY